MTTTTQGQLHLAVQDCTRCGGSGEYSWCQRFGSRCFKCDGKGIQLTADAERAQQLITDWRQARTLVQLDQLEAGDKVRMGNETTWRTVVDVNARGGIGTRNADGTTTWHPELVTRRVTYSVTEHTRIYRRMTAAERAELDAYADTLAGTFRR